MLWTIIVVLLVLWLLGLIGTRSISKEIPGIEQIKQKNRTRIVSGIEAVKALEALRQQPQDAAARELFERHKADLGFGLLLKRYLAHVQDATPEQVQRAVDSTVPRVAPMFWSFRVMVGLAFLMLALFALSFRSTLKGSGQPKPWLLKWAVWMLPAPWIACAMTWLFCKTTTFGSIVIFPPP